MKSFWCRIGGSLQRSQCYGRDLLPPTLPGGLACYIVLWPSLSGLTNLMSPQQSACISTLQVYLILLKLIRQLRLKKVCRLHSFSITYLQRRDTRARKKMGRRIHICLYASCASKFTEWELLIMLFSELHDAGKTAYSILHYSNLHPQSKFGLRSWRTFLRKVAPHV